MIGGEANKFELGSAGGEAERAESAMSVNWAVVESSGTFAVLKNCIIGAVNVGSASLDICTLSRHA